MYLIPDYYWVGTWRDVWGLHFWLRTWNCLHKIIISFEWSQNDTDWEEQGSERALYTSGKQLWSKAANENTWMLSLFLSPGTQVNINPRKLLFSIQSRKKISLVYGFVYGIFLFTKVYTRPSGSLQCFMFWEEIWKTVS